MKLLFDFNANQSGNSPKTVAQSHLKGLSHYVDSDTLKYFSCSIAFVRVIDSGRVLGLIERLPVGSFDSDKVYRAVFFSIDGMAIRDESLTYKTKKAAVRGFWEQANKLDGAAVYKTALNNLINWKSFDIRDMQDALKELKS